MVSRKTLFVLLLTIGVTQIGFAQTTTATANAAPATAAPTATDGGTPHYVIPETPEHRAVRVGNIDPGPNPDPKQIFYRYGKRYHIEKYDNLRSRVILTGGEVGWGRPFGWVNIYREVYQLNDKYTWFWIEEHDEASPDEVQKQAAEETNKWPEASLAYFRQTRSEFAQLTPPPANKAIKFVESSDGLPKTGSWRNSLAVADMNGDGLLDIIAPPERQGGNIPAIFLGDGKGHWKYWDSKWPFGLNYGSVVAADFNQDGKMDLAFGVHLDGVHVFLGDGKGNFTDSSEGLPRDFPTRRVIVAD
ncbi:MAG TPA: VCBS repeat-containing protein, partial [Nitrolancea sp.]|nr:VCBS repeat-containing protein [Nitrolancea sp.]